MNDATKVSQEAIKAALLEGGDTWRNTITQLSDAPGSLHGANLSELDLSNRDLSSLDLSHADFFGGCLASTNLKKSNLHRAELANSDMQKAALYKADLREAILHESNLANADLSSSDCRGADFRGAILRGAKLAGADLRGADFSQADLTGADLSYADVTGAKFHFAQLSEANVTHLKYGNYREMVGLYLGVRGIDQCYGSALFLRDAKDQDYIDTLYQSLNDKQPGFIKALDLFLFRAWALIDHGRSLLKVSFYATIIAMLYGFVYLADMTFGWNIMDYSNSAETWFTPFYYSVVTYTTLGYGDVTANSLLGEMLVISEVIVGYFTLGLLLAILANTIARRS
ncbi:pentapeptide repeat-containing protein [Aliiroseovarius sp. KMU-50]|uniref:Pentapeptide repeat-containing protein n=1 Tax=Aliiroseovarius salicola TaxID=3009082 RepID=A0ABT4VZP7_9RHOB|nr:pentapeptide repeat-containing protein [Aliiroseovarius sp. KMU-50]MDA5093725.1 pentapeptide repeat-containing protein [Aliiroseovarius sp. KMU-50]